ncbi:MAG: MBL fold metallo-hydrolase [Candidatus Thorarchaeota archaeon]|nr:MBL fold metallo-hydrolase [Candidatus Thorarchaeota archaeon]
MGITIKCMAHATFKIKTEKQVIYIDPTTKGTGLKKDHFEPADLILVTHGHQDHFDKDLLKKIRKLGSPVIAPLNLQKEMKGIPMWDLSEGQFMKMADGSATIWAVPAYNVKRFKSPGNPFHPKGYGLGYIIKIDDKKIYHAGDTDLIPEMEKITDIDVALLPSGDTYTMDNMEAAEAAILIKPKVAIPMHLKDSNPEVFKNEVEAKSSTKVVILRNGEEYTLE